MLLRRMCLLRQPKLEWLSSALIGRPFFSVVLISAEEGRIIKTTNKEPPFNHSEFEIGSVYQNNDSEAPARFLTRFLGFSLSIFIPGRRKGGRAFKANGEFNSRLDIIAILQVPCTLHSKNKEGGPGPSQICLLYTSPSPRDRQKSRMPSSA